MRMLTFWLLALAPGVLSASVLSAEPPSSITIRANQTILKAGSPIELQVTFTNTSDRGISLFVDKSRSAELSDFGVELTDSKGKVPKITRYHDALTGEKAPRETIADPGNTPLIISSGGDAVLAPGKARDFRMDVARLFDVKEPGKYSIRLKRTDPADGIPVMSTLLKITITK